MNATRGAMLGATLLALTGPLCAEYVHDLPVKVWVDPGRPLANEPANTREDRVFKPLGEWNTSGQLDNWTPVAPTTASVAGGILTLGEGSAPAAAELALPAGSQPDLDFAFNDFLLIRCKLPLGATGDLKFSFTTTFEPEFSPEKSFAIPAASLRADGAFHEYLVDLGLVRRWRSQLTRLRIEPFANSPATTRTIQVDFLRLGDPADDPMAINTNLNFFTGEDLTTCSRVESKHFALWWSPESERFLKQIAPDYPPFATDYERQRNALRMLEESYQYYCKVLGYREPFYHIDGKVPGKFKLNATTWWQGGFGSAHQGFPTINIHATSMNDDRATNPNIHEFGHSIQTTGPGAFAGNHWESHVGGMHTSYMYYWGEVTDARLNLAPLSWINYVDKTLYKSSLMFEWPGFVYADRRPYLYLNEDLDQLGLPHNLTSIMWNTPPRDQYFPDALRRQVGAAMMKDLTLGWSRRIPFFDNPYGSLEREWFYNVVQKSPREMAMKRQRSGMILAACPDRPNTWRSTSGTAPMNMGYSFYQLERPAGGTASARVDMLDIAGSSEDLRWCLVAVASDQGVRYSGISKPGETVSMQLDAAETELWLVVAGTPDTQDYNLVLRENILNLDKSPARMRYPFEVVLQGTTPMAKQVAMPSVAGHQHGNGGGFVANTAMVEPSAYVGPDARVLGTAKVYQNARIEGHATVVDATVRDSARISGSALVYGGSVVISGNARIRDRALAQAGVTISGNALMADHATLSSGSLGENATARGLSETYTTSPYLAQVAGHAILDGDYVMPWNATDGVHKTHVPWGEFYWDYYAKWLKKPEGLVARYRIEEPDGAFLWDTLGSLHALVRGTPRRAYDATMADNVLVLDGTQHVLLDSTLGDSTSFSFAGWVRLDAASPANAPMLFLGHKSSEFIALVPKNSNGLPELTVQSAAGTLRVVGTTPLPAANWSHLGITLDGATASLFVDGALTASAACDFSPCQVVTPDIQTLPQANYLGRGWAGNFLRASLDDLRFYNVAITPAAMAAARRETGRTLALLFDQTPLVMAAGDTAVVDTGVVSPDECTLIFEINPAAVDDVPMYRPILDSQSNPRQVSGTYSPGIGIDAGKFIVYLNGLGRWDTGVACRQDVWQRVALTYGSNGTRLFVDGVEAAFRGGEQAFPREVTFQLGCSRSPDASRFVGTIRNVRILDRAMDRSEVLRAMGANVQRISVSCGYGGSVSPASEALVATGASQTFTITPAAGFAIQDVLVDGASIGTPTSYTFTNVTKPRTLEARFRKTGAYLADIPDRGNLMFGCLAGVLPASGSAGDWPTWQPTGGSLLPVNYPEALTENGRRWVNNRYAATNGYRLGQFTTPIPCNGATAVVAVKPVRTGIASAYTAILSVFSDNLMLGIRNDTGAIFVSRKGVHYSSNVIIPDGQVTILSLVVQPSGAYKVFANGSEVISVTTTSTFTSLTPGTSANNSTIMVGRNAADGWSTFNGLIGDLFFFTSAQSDANRQLVENLITRNLTETPSLAASPPSQTLESPGGTVTTTLTTNQAWSRTILGGSGWLTAVEPSAGVGDATLTYQVAPNTGTTARTATIVISGGGLTTYQTITSAPPSSPLTITGWQSLGSHAGTLRGLPVDDGFIEPRASGLHTLVVTFSRPITLAAGQPAATATGTGQAGNLTLAGLGCQIQASATGNQLTLRITNSSGTTSPLPDASRWRISLNTAAISATDGSPIDPASPTTRLIATLRGDTNNSGSVDATDLNQILNSPATPADSPATLRADIDGDALPGTADITTAWANRNQRTSQLPSP